MTRGDTFGNNSLSVTPNILSSVIPDLIGDLLFYEGCGFPIDIFGNDKGDTFGNGRECCENAKESYDGRLKSMSFIKTSAILFKSRKYKERDKLLTFFTEENGKIISLCKGARLPLNRWGSSTEPPNLSYIQLYEKGEFFTLTEIKTVEIFLNIISDFQRLLIFDYIANILDWFIPLVLVSKKTFYLALSTLYALNDKEISPLTTGYFFALKFLDLQGYRLELNRCVKCGRKIDQDLDNFCISYEEGGFICDSCSKFATSAYVRLSKIELSFLKSFLTLEIEDISKISLLDVKNSENFDKIINDYYYAKFKKRVYDLNKLVNGKKE